MAGAAAVVLLSGGLDSATTLAWARREGYDCHCLSVDYGQRHRAELDAAAKIASTLGAAAHKVIKLDLTAFGGSALTDASVQVPTSGVGSGIPVTYVPARNTILLSLALGWAEVLGARHIFVGANAVDYSGYPDCRPEYLRAFEAMANLATKAAVEGRSIEVRGPLVDKSKAEIVRLAIELGVDPALTVTCYQPDASGRACGICDACRIRKSGFAAAGVPDTTRYMRMNETTPAQVMPYVLGGSFALAFVFGAVANKTNFCTMGAVSDWVNMGDSGRMRMWLLAIAVAILGANGAAARRA